ncbi:MAG: glycosyltransferase family 39 protein, partial [Chitinophagales bacterium]|nr:glycosyltransferase family 39 protein [Chitinophagales bacterium]
MKYTTYFVAKNLTFDLLHPTLYKTPLLPYDFRDWSGNHTWIHKQPLFLWLISLSIKLFGVTEKAVRLPSLVMVSTMVLMMYRVAGLLSNHRAAFITALLISSHYTYLQNMSGIFLVDHNNIAFLFFVTASFACWLEFEFLGKAIWLYVMGLAVGCAILVKWLVGLLVFVPFVVLHLFIKKDLLSRKVGVPFLISLFIVSLIVIPWQLYCYLRFPDEFLYEMSFNAKHIWQALEGHKGGWDFYFKNLSSDYEGLYWL